MPINAADLYLDVNGVSKHLGTDKSYNEKNIGGGLTLEDVGSNRWVKNIMVGGYKNSLDRNTYYAGAGLSKRIPLNKSMYADVGAMAGGFSGYGDNIVPAILPMASIGLKDLWKLRLLYAMETEDNPATLMMNLGIPIK